MVQVVCENVSKLHWPSWIRSKYVSSLSGFYHGHLEDLLALSPSAHLGQEHDRPSTFGRGDVPGA